VCDEVYEQRLMELQQQDQQLRARFEISTQALSIARNRGLEAFFQAILPDIEAEMDERGGQALIEVRTLVASAQDIDITDDVITRVNGRITSLEVELLPQRQPAEE
jgi:Skp family chaperone for outer membrane proteins